MYDFANSYITNFGPTEGSNSWTTRCLSISEHATQGITALSCDCLMEDVPFVSPKNLEKKIFKENNSKFYTAHNNGKWFQQKNSSIHDTIYFHSNTDPLSTLGGVLGDRRSYDISEISIQKEFIPIKFRKSGNRRSLDFAYSQPIIDWHQKRSELIQEPIIFAPGFGGDSEVFFNPSKPTNTFSLDQISGNWNPASATLNDIPISFYSCLIETERQKIYFPLRYVNKGIEYIQPISGTIAISNGITGSIAFAFDLNSSELICEFSLRCHVFSSPYCATLKQYIVPVEINPCNIHFYTFT